MQTDGQTDGLGDYYRAPPTSSGGALIRLHEKVNNHEMICHNQN